MQVNFQITSPASAGPPPMAGMTVTYKLPVLIWVGSVEYQFQDLLLSAALVKCCESSICGAQQYVDIHAN